MEATESVVSAKQPSDTRANDASNDAVDASRAKRRHDRARKADSAPHFLELSLSSVAMSQWHTYQLTIRLKPKPEHLQRLVLQFNRISALTLRSLTGRLSSKLRR